MLRRRLRAHPGPRARQVVLHGRVRRAEAVGGQIAASLPLAQSGETRHEPWDSTPIPGVLVGERVNEQALLEADLDREQ